MVVYRIKKLKLPHLEKNMKKMLIFVTILFGVVFVWKMVKIGFIHFMEMEQLKHRLVTVSALTAEKSSWQPHLNIVGSTRTVKGVNVTAELGGLITQIDFQPGAVVKKGDLLVQQDISTNVAHLHALEAEAVFAKITYDRNVKQLKIGAISEETLAENKSQLDSSTANVAEEKATIAQKTIRAPFSGRLGISQVNPGQYLHPGDPIVNLQTLSPIYVDYYLPQQYLSILKTGMPVTITTDAYPDKTYAGNITTLNPMVESDLRNIAVEATLPNQNASLLPGMFVNVEMNTGKPEDYVTLPQMAVTFNPYGDVVFVLNKTGKKFKGKTVWEAKQEFVNVGDKRGNQIAILKGVEPGQMVVTSGQLKLMNGSKVLIDNTLAPSMSPEAHPGNP